MKEIAACFKKYFDFKGKSSRREYSCFLIFKILVGWAFMFLAGVLEYDISVVPLIVYLIFVFFGLLQIATIIPFVAVVVRRLHDIGKSGWFALLLLFPCISLIFKVYLVFAKGVKANSEEAQSEVAQGDTEDKLSGCLILVLILVLALPFISFLAGVIIGAQGPINEKVDQLQRQAMLRDMYVYLQTYHENFGSFPSVQPKATRYEMGGGVRDLYPLAYTRSIGEKELNDIMHPPGGKFDKFSAELGPVEFDKNHIGWSYNSCARIDSEDPLMADQGVSSAYLNFQTKDRGIKPLSTKNVLVLFANGRIESVPVNRKNGKLLGDKVKDWSVLKD